MSKKDNIKQVDSKSSPISRSEFIINTGVLAGSTILFSRFAFGQECDLTTDDILGPYFVEGAPIRMVIAHPDEPGKRLFVSGRILQNDCKTPIAGAMLEIWHANDAGCYSINQDCTATGNPENDEYNLRGKMFSNANGQYAFETILPGNYSNRPMHIHIKITTQDGEVLVSQLYFAGDPLCDIDPWCSEADDRIIALQEDTAGLHGEMEFVMDSTVSGIIPGDVNMDGYVNVQDIVMAVGIILGNIQADNFQMYAADVNGDTEVDILDIVLMINLILGSRRFFQSLKGGHLKIEDGLVSISSLGEVAGIQLFTRGNFKIKRHHLPKGWKFHHEKGIILMYNQNGGRGVPEQLFEYEGDIEVVSNIITGWDAQRLVADINLHPLGFRLSSPYPNPFNPHVNISLNQQHTSLVKLSVYDIKGRELTVLFDGMMMPGKSSFTWNASIYPTGIYFIKAIGKSQTQIKKVQLLK